MSFDESRVTQEASFEELAEVVRTLPKLLPVYTQDARMTLSATAEFFSIDRKVMTIWNVVARDILTARAVELGLMVDATPEGATMQQYLGWLSNRMCGSWIRLLTRRELEEREAVRYMVAVYRRSNRDQRKAA